MWDSGVRGKGLRKGVNGNVKGARLKGSGGIRGK